MSKTEKTLTGKQAKFVEEYLIDLNATQAAIRAGYSQKTARQIAAENLTKPVIQEAVAQGFKKRSERVEVDQDYVLSTIVDTVERCRQAKPVTDRQGEPILTETPNGDVVPAFAFDSRAVLKGAELCGKHLGMFIDKVEHTGKDGGPIDMVSDRDVARKLALILSKEAG